MDRRLVPGESAESVLAGIQAVVEPLGATERISIQPMPTHTGLRLDGPSFCPGWLLPESGPLLATGKATGATLFGEEPGVGVWRFSTDGTIEARKYCDIAGQPGGDHLFLVDQRSVQRIDCGDVALTYGRQLTEDIRNRTETAMTHAHCFLVSELALAAEANATRLGNLR